MGTSMNAAMDTLAMARQLVASGVSVVPFVRGTKDLAYDRLPRTQSATDTRAKPRWSPFRERRPTDTELVAWFQDEQCNVAGWGHDQRRAGRARHREHRSV
jgi:hypothetical protein